MKVAYTVLTDLTAMKEVFKSDLSRFLQARLEESSVGLNCATACTRFGTNQLFRTCAGPTAVKLWIPGAIEAYKVASRQVQAQVTSWIT